MRTIIKMIVFLAFLGCHVAKKQDKDLLVSPFSYYKAIKANNMNKLSISSLDKVIKKVDTLNADTLFDYNNNLAKDKLNQLFNLLENSKEDINKIENGIKNYSFYISEQENISSEEIDKILRELEDVEIDGEEVRKGNERTTQLRNNIASKIIPLLYFKLYVTNIPDKNNEEKISILIKEKGKFENLYKRLRNEIDKFLLEDKIVLKDITDKSQSSNPFESKIEKEIKNAIVFFNYILDVDNVSQYSIKLNKRSKK